MKNILRILLLTLFVTSNLFAQQSRLDALGGLSYSITDVNSQIDPFILGNNPAWLVNSQKEQRLEMNPHFTNSSGDYHRYFESGNINNTSVSFMGLKPLGSSGTFRGSASYTYELKKNRNRALTLTPYSGDAFFFTDTTSGDYRYSGPTFEFMHSLAITNNLYLGASVNYKILDGLKKVYTFAETLYRNVSGNIGLAYKASDALAFGVNYQIFDMQERILADDVNARDVQTYLYRGENNRIKLRGASQDFKIKQFGNSLSFQAQLIATGEITVGLNAKYMLSNSSSLFRVTAIIDSEDGYSSFENTNINLQARWLQSDVLTLGFTGGYVDNNSWSKNSKRNLTLWKLDVNDIFAGVGFTYTNKSNTFLVGAEYELHSISADSAKYVDNKFLQISALNHVMRVGVEKPINEMFLVRIGYNFLYKNHDFIYGGNNVATHYITLGGKIRLSDAMEIEPRIEYAMTNLSNNSLYKNNLGIYTTLRFYKF